MKKDTPNKKKLNVRLKSGDAPIPPRVRKKIQKNEDTNARSQEKRSFRKDNEERSTRSDFKRPPRKDNEERSTRSDFKRPPRKDNEERSTRSDVKRPFRKEGGENDARSRSKRPPRKGEVVRETPSYNTERFKEIAKKKQKPAESDSQNELRLNRYLSNAGICSRREADSLITKGDVEVNGKVVTEMGHKVKRSDEVKYKGKVISPEKKVYVLLNKPRGFITTMNDPQERRTVMELVKNASSERVYPVGRLDRNTSGLLLFTNDGELATQLTHPSGLVQKIYHVVLDKPLTRTDFETLTKEGVTLEDGPVPLDGLSVLSDDMTTLGVELHSGKNRIVRRVFEHFGYQVEKLDRTVFAGLTKIDLPRGKWRYLSEKEVIQLKYFTGKNKKKKSES